MLVVCVVDSASVKAAVEKTTSLMGEERLDAFAGEGFFYCSGNVSNW